MAATGFQHDRGTTATDHGLTTEGYIRLLWPDDDAQDDGDSLNIWTLPRRQSYWFSTSDIGRAATTAEQLAERYDVYLATARIDLAARKRRAAAENSGACDVKTIRGTNDTASAIPGLWADVDVGGPIHGEGHKNWKLPPTYEDARALVAEAIPLEPTIIIDSGHGMYFWWLFTEPWSLDTGVDREEAADLVYRFQQTLQKKASACGWEIDGTADLARVLRLPGTFNRKLDPVPVRIIAVDETRRYQTDSFDRYIVDVDYRSVICEPVPLPDELDPVDLDSLPLPPYIKRLVVTGNEWIEDKQAYRYGSRSQAVWRVVNEMVEAGCDDARIAAVLLDDRFKISENPLEKGRRAREFVAREIGKARKVHANEPQGPPVDPEDASTVSEPRILAETLGTFHRWLYLPDDGVVLATLGAAAANCMEDDPDPCWLLIVGGSAGGKTEILMSLAGLPKTRIAASINVAGLLSGTAKKDRDKGSRGGLLMEIGSFGMLILKDFTTIISQNRDARAETLAALREVYDGRYVRNVGVDGGKTLEWSGKLGVVGAVTDAIDTAHAVVGALGERFTYYRLPPNDGADVRKDLAERALSNGGMLAQMRRELSEAVAGLFAGLEIPPRPPIPGERDRDRLIALASLVARCRSAVERDYRTREIELVYSPESPARIAQALARLSAGLHVIGVDDDRRWQVLRHVGLSSMPKARRAVLEHLAGASEPSTTTAVAAAVRLPTQTTRRCLEDLTAHFVVDRQAGGEGKADRWSLSSDAHNEYRLAAGSVPGMSEDAHTRDDASSRTKYASDDIPGKAGDEDDRHRHCWSCGSELLEELDEQCSECGWLRCRCGACGCKEDGK